LALNVRRGRIQLSDVDAIDQRICSLHVVVEPAPTVESIRLLIRFATEHRLTAYDSAYVLLAQHTGAALATVDNDMRASARRLDIRLLPA
jgi:predicted nucleic acid-binding protein